jgi:hypothetical protein
MPLVLFARCKMIVLEMIGDFSDHDGRVSCYRLKWECLTIKPII